MTFSNPVRTSKARGSAISLGNPKKKKVDPASSEEISHEAQANGMGTTSMAPPLGMMMPHAKMGGKIAVGGPNSSGLFNGQSDFDKSKSKRDSGAGPKFILGGMYKFTEGKFIPAEKDPMGSGGPVTTISDVSHKAGDLVPTAGDKSAGRPASSGHTSAGRSEPNKSGEQPLTERKMGGGVRVPTQNAMLRERRAMREGSAAEERSESPAFEAREKASGKEPAYKEGGIYKYAGGGNWIAGAIGKPGALHAEMGVPKGEKIPQSKLNAAASKPGVLGKRARLAKTLESFHK